MAAVRPRPGIASIRAHMLGAPLAAPRPAIDIASNESAFGASPRACEAAARVSRSLERYPDDAPGQLASAIARTFSLDAGRITCGHGSDDLLARLARAFLQPGDELIHSVNGYQKIPNYAFANDAVPVAAADRGLRADVEALLAAVTPRTRIVMIANPDNPTGSLLTAGEVRRLHAGLPGHVLLVLDSAYAEYVDTPDYELPDRLVEESDNIVMTRTFSKIYGLAGARVGWMYGPADVVDTVRRIALTFPLGGVAAAAALAALEDEAHTRHVLAETRWLRSWFGDRLAGLGLEVYPSETNFVLVRFPDPARPAAAADRHLLSQGIRSRRFASPAFSECIRFTIGREAEMRAAADALEAFLTLRGAA
ncbi:histidinol-phosphate transaminase [Geminicoccaceae bacterium 1502E]|nr:histidinol-phosphate transaminase [Geminicoccaceae bacterium 1502E]